MGRAEKAKLAERTEEEEEAENIPKSGWRVRERYRVSHPILCEILSCFVLGVPLRCLGSSYLQ